MTGEDGKGRPDGEAGGDRAGLARAEAFAGIGIATTRHPAGSFIAADETGRTSVPGVWVAGNSTWPPADRRAPALPAIRPGRA